MEGKAHSLVSTVHVQKQNSSSKPSLIVKLASDTQIDIDPFKHEEDSILKAIPLLNLGHDEFVLALIPTNAVKWSYLPRYKIAEMTALAIAEQDHAQAMSILFQLVRMDTVVSLYCVNAVYR